MGPSPIRAGSAKTKNTPSSSAPMMGSRLNGGWLLPKRASTNPNGLIREDQRMVNRQMLSWLRCTYCLAQQTFSGLSLPQAGAVFYGRGGPEIDIIKQAVAYR
jgi:hypothetical protein